jgi:hypothetical protein
MSDVGQRYAVPPEIDQFLDQGFLEVREERPDGMTVEFRIPSRVSVDRRRRITAYRIVWHHPARNAEACDYYEETAGDMPNFYVEIQNSEGPSEIIDDLKTVDDLEAWLEDFQSESAAP